MVLLCVATSSENRKMFLVKTSNIVHEQGNETSGGSDYGHRYGSGCIEQGVDFWGNPVSNRKFHRILNIQSAHACACACQQHAECKVFTWAANIKECYLKTSDKGRRRGRSYHYSGSEHCCKSCIQASIDFAGNDLSTSPLKDIKSSCDCASSCVADHACSAFTWNSANKVCHKKSSGNGEKAHVLGHSGKMECFKAKPCIEAGVDFGGNDLRNSPVKNIPSAVGCGCACSKNAGCTHFTWNSKTKDCHIKYSDGGRRHSPHGHSGTVDCYKGA